MMHVHFACQFQLAMATRDKPGWVSWYECSICNMHLRGDLVLELAEAWVECTSVLSANNFQRLASGLNFGRQLVLQCHYVQAERLLRALHTRASALHGAEHEFALSIAGEIVSALSGQLKTEDALLLARAVYEARARTLRRDHKDTMRISERIGHLLTQLSRADEALVFRVRTYEAYVRVSGPSDIRTIRAAAFADMSRAILGLPADDRAHRALLSAQTQAYGAEHAETLSTIQMLTNMRILFGSYNEAHRMLAEAHPVMCRILGASNTITLHAKRTMDSLLAGARCSSPSCMAVLDLRQYQSVCSACKRVRYCTRECQRSDWKRHKPLCSQLSLSSPPSLK
jgi:hypothetical protein